MKVFTGATLGADVGLLGALTIMFLTNNLPSWWFGYWIALIGIMNVVAYVREMR